MRIANTRPPIINRQWLFVRATSRRVKSHRRAKHERANMTGSSHRTATVSPNSRHHELDALRRVQSQPRRSHQNNPPGVCCVKISRVPMPLHSRFNFGGS